MGKLHRLVAEDAVDAVVNYRRDGLSRDPVALMRPLKECPAHDVEIMIAGDYRQDGRGGRPCPTTDQ